MPSGALISTSTQAQEVSLGYTCTRNGTCEFRLRESCYISVVISLLQLDGARERLAGWWGHDPSTRFNMPSTFSPIPGAQGFQQSNPSVLSTVSLLGSLQVFKKAGMMQPLRERSLLLTGDLEKRLLQSSYFVPVFDAHCGYGSQRPNGDERNPGFTIITPSDPRSRGAQLSLLFFPRCSEVMHQVFDWLASHGVVCDKREPDVIRLSPAPLYNTFDDCERAAHCLEEALNSLGDSH